jgi:hypothetical protein
MIENVLRFFLMTYECWFRFAKVAERAVEPSLA